jgi:hypothetical protein
MAEAGFMSAADRASAAKSPPATGDVPADRASAAKSPPATGDIPADRGSAATSPPDGPREIVSVRIGGPLGIRDPEIAGLVTVTFADGAVARFPVHHGRKVLLLKELVAGLFGRFPAHRGSAPKSPPATGGADGEAQGPRRAEPGSGQSPGRET